MADNNFDFQLRADDQASEVLQEIADKVKVLQPQLVKTREGMALGGQETQEGLTAFGSSFENMSRLAKDNVQFFGDMVPPLKNVSALAGDFAGKALKFGAIGATAYGVVKGVTAAGSAMSAAAEDAYSLNVAAKNAGTSVHDFSQLSGAMRLLGTDSASAQSSVEGLYKTFNDALQGRNSNVLAVMAQLNAPIARNADGTANILKTMESLAEIFPKLAPQNQKTVADALGLNAETLQLLREGARLKGLLAKSDRVGLTIDPQVNEQLTQFDRSLNEVSASWDGFKSRMEQKLYSKIDSDGGLTNMVNGLSDMFEYGFDNISIGKFSGQNKGNDSALMRRAQADPEFLKLLDSNEKHQLEAGVMTDAARKKYQRYFNNTDGSRQLVDDLSAAQAAAQRTPDTSGVPPASRVNNQARSVRNNNPWNLRYAGQRDAVPAGDNFAAFPSPESGLLAADRQLQLYASGRSAAAKNVPLKTIRDIISIASPSNENNTPQMIQDASRELNVSPDQELNLNDTGMRSRVLHALFEREGNNPWSTEQIEQLITRAGNGERNSNPLIPPSQNIINPPQDASTPLITAQQPAAQVQTQELTEALTTALNENGLKVELTLINEKTGDRKTLTGTGGKVSTAMTFP